MFRAEDLGREPENGDRIEFEGGVYLVCAPNREPCWCWHGNDTGVYRIHAKKLAEPPEPVPAEWPAGITVEVKHLISKAKKS